MARMLIRRNSVAVYKRATLRHIRLCNQTYGINKYSRAITPPYEALKEKDDIYEQVKMDRYFAHDSLIMSEHLLDNAVRSLFENCKQYERDNNDSLLLSSFFPHERFGDMIRRKRTRELHEVEQIALKFESLGEKHPLYKFASLLRSKIHKVWEKMSAYTEALRLEKIAQAEVDIAKEVLRKQYEKNYFDAKQEKGRVKADYMFPNIFSKHKEKPIKNNHEEESAEAA